MAKSDKKRSAREISAIMRRVRSSNTSPEVSFRAALRSQGIRYKVSLSNLPGKPDVALPSKRLAIFIDGDFWHGGQWVRRDHAALEDQFGKTASKDYWLRKIRRNMERDCAATAKLLSDGWSVLRFWESQLHTDLEGCIGMTIEAIQNGASKESTSLLPPKTFAEFFAGIGLMRMGLERQGWTIAFANDIDPSKHEMYRGQFPDAPQHFVLGDIHELSADQIPSVSLATASFPCNDLSVAGAREGLDGKQSSAFWGFMRLLEEMRERRPPIVLIENVVGFLTSHKGGDFKDALSALNRLGYDVDAFILDAAHFVPQSRQRLFVVGAINSNMREVRIRERRRFYGSEVRPDALADFILTHPEIRWSIRNLPAPPPKSETVETIVEEMPETDKQWWSAERVTYLLNQMSPRHRTTAEKMIQGRTWSYGTVFRRIRKGRSMGELRTDGIAGCLRTPRGGSGRQILFKAGYGKCFARLLTPRECARLMGADDYRIAVPLNQALFGFGDAVCVPVIEWVAKYYLNPLVNELIHGRLLTGKLQEAHA